MTKSNIDDISPDTLFDAVKLLPSAGRAELRGFFPHHRPPSAPEDGEILARIADIPELLLG
jgi:hypothetical protein